MKIYIERFISRNYQLSVSMDEKQMPEFFGYFEIQNMVCSKAEPIFDLFRGAPQLLEAVDTAIAHFQKKVFDKAELKTEEIALFGQLRAAARNCRVLRPKGENP